MKLIKTFWRLIIRALLPIFIFILIGRYFLGLYTINIASDRLEYVNNEISHSKAFEDLPKQPTNRFPPDINSRTISTGKIDSSIVMGILNIPAILQDRQICAELDTPLFDSDDVIEVVFNDDSSDLSKADAIFVMLQNENNTISILNEGKQQNGTGSCFPLGHFPIYKYSTIIFDSQPIGKTDGILYKGNLILSAPLLHPTEAYIALLLIAISIWSSCLQIWEFSTKTKKKNRS